MALTRKLLKGMGLTDEQVDTIIEAHTDVVDGLKDEINSNKDAVKKLADAEKKLGELEAQGNDGYKEKYDKEHSNFEKFKADIVAKETRESKGKAFLSILNLANIKGANADFVMDSKTAEKMIDELEIKDGKVVNQEDVVKAVTEKWGNYAERKGVINAPVPNPPTNTGGTSITKEDFAKMSYKDRLKIYNENSELYNELNS